MDGESYITANPFTFDISTYWEYADLQRLCKKCNISAKGSREKLVQRLIEFHRQRDKDGTTLINDDCTQNENIPMNVNGNNFAMMQVTVVPSSTEKLTKSKYRISKASDVSKKAIIKACPTTLKPLLTSIEETKIPATPSKSILKRTELTPPPSAQKSVCKETPSKSKSMPDTPGKLDKITFSPFNAVKVIPHRTGLGSITKTVIYEQEYETDESHLEDTEEDDECTPTGTSKRIQFMLNSDEDENEEEMEIDEYDEEEEDFDIYSDDEDTHNLVCSNTQLNSSVLYQVEEYAMDEESTTEMEEHVDTSPNRNFIGDKYDHLRSHEFFEF